MPIEKPEIIWKNGAPFSVAFNDIYYSTKTADSGIKESSYVFLEGNNLKKRWENSPAGSFGRFHIFENGFGTGLNFALTCQSFLKSRENKGNNPPVRFLHYIATEKYPLSRSEIQRALSFFPGLQSIYEPIVFSYPDPVSGFHRLSLFDNKVTLTLIMEDCLYALKELLCPMPIEAWFLDGFNPSQNPQMWQDEFIRQMAFFSTQGSSVSTFSAAGHIKRKLQAAGFQVEKKAGFGQKREMITATYSPVSPVTPVTPESLKASLKPLPWFVPPVHLAKKQTVAIIGGGLAGCALGEAFARRGYQSTIIEQNSHIAGGASGNPLGIFFPVLHRAPTPTSRLSKAAYFYLLGRLRDLCAEGLKEKLKLRQKGLIRHVNQDELAFYKELLQKDRENENIFEIPDCRSGSESGNVIFLKGGYVSPAGLCQANLERHKAKSTRPENHGADHSVKVLLNNRAVKVRHDGQYWFVDTDQKISIQSEVLIFANSYQFDDFFNIGSPLQKVRGQLMSLPLSEKITGWELPISAKTYVIPSERQLLIGASHDFSENTEIEPAQNQRLWQDTLAFLPELKQLHKQAGYSKEEDWIKAAFSRVSFRSAAGDHFPVIGPVPKAGIYRQRFAGLRHGETAYLRKKGYDGQDNAWYPNLYALTGLGSRGILYSQLGAEIIASFVNKEPLPIEKSLFYALSPARFLFRGIKKGLISR